MQIDFYPHRAGRVCPLAPSASCVSPAIEINSMNSRWVEHTVKAAKDIELIIWAHRCISFTLFRHNQLKATDLILKHPTISNSLIILSRGISQTMAAFGLKRFFNDFGCRFLSYVHRVGRGVSISTTCLLSVFQTIKISPMNSCWKDLKVKDPKVHWLFHFPLLDPVHVCEFNCSFVCVQMEHEKHHEEKGFGYCFANDHEKITSSIYVALIVFPAFSFSVIIIWASDSMIFTLYRHKQWVQYIHRNNLYPRFSPESRATQSILVLVSTFVSFQTLSSIIHICIA
ncbi:hypothetical protein HPG69_013983, partial [Diceros bicornis minor]